LVLDLFILWPYGAIDVGNGWCVGTLVVAMRGINFNHSPSWALRPHILQIAGGIDAGNRLDAILLGASVSACEKGRKWEHAISLLAQATKLESYDFM